MTDRLIKMPQVESAVGFKKSWIYKKIKEGAFPAPVHVGASSRWSEAAIAEWISQQTAQTA